MSETRPRGVRRNRDQWRRLIDEQAGSAMTQAAFCRAKAISLASFQNWKRRLSAEEPGEPWFELGTLGSAQAARWDIELELGGGIWLRLRRC
jgi:hypothetical protein